MGVRWLSRKEFLEKVDKMQGILVVIPGEGEELERTASSMEKFLRRVNEEMLNEGFIFSLELSGGVGEGKLPVFFIKESDFGGEERGLIRVVPLGCQSGQVMAGKRGLEGVNSLNKTLVKHLAWQVWAVMSGHLEEYEQSREELGI